MPVFNLIKHFSLTVMKINFQVEREKKQHWITLAVQILKDFVEMWKSMSSKQEWRTVLLWVHDHNSVCAAHLFIKSGLWIPSPLHFLAPLFSLCDLFQTWLSSSHHTVGTFNGFPELLLGCLRLHLMLWGSFATPVHFYPQDTVFHTCQAFAPSLHLLSVPCLVCSPVALCLATSFFRLHMDSSRKTSWQLRLT